MAVIGPRRNRFRLLIALLAVTILASACAEDERRGLRLTSTSTTVETGVRVLADNCPGPSSVQLSVREEILWEIQFDPNAPAPETAILSLIHI